MPARHTAQPRVTDDVVATAGEIDPATNCYFVAIIAAAHYLIGAVAPASAWPGLVNAATVASAAPHFGLLHQPTL